jgi:hypothetical protein
MGRLFTVVGFVMLPRDVELSPHLEAIVLDRPRMTGEKWQELHYVVSASHCNAEPYDVISDLRQRFIEVGARSMTAITVWGLDEVQHMVLGAPSWAKDRDKWAAKHNDKNLEKASRWSKCMGGGDS